VESFAKAWSLLGIHPRTLKLVLTVGALVLATGNAATQTARAPFDHDGLARQALELHIRPFYADFASKADMLHRRLDETCRTRAPNGELAIKTAYSDLLLAWSRTEHLRFGPVIDENRFERVTYWPDRQKIGERQVAQILSRGDPGALTAAQLAKKSVAVQGLTALEIVLYGNTGGSLLQDAPGGKFACGYATAIAENIRHIAKEVVSEWADDGRFATWWLRPGEENPVYRTSTDTTVELLKAFRAGIYNARDLKLLPSLGLKRIAARGQLAPKSRPPYELSTLALASMIANTEGAFHLYAKGGFAERLALIEPEGDRLTRSNLVSAIQSMRELEPSGLAVFNEQPLMDKLAHVRDPLAFSLSESARALAEVSGIGAMVLGFMDDDGD
jgi:predicted lipoprotein